MAKGPPRYSPAGKHGTPKTSAVCMLICWEGPHIPCFTSPTAKKNEFQPIRGTPRRIHQACQATWQPQRSQGRSGMCPKVLSLLSQKLGSLAPHSERAKLLHHSEAQFAFAVQESECPSNPPAVPVGAHFGLFLVQLCHWSLPQGCKAL